MSLDGRHVLAAGTVITADYLPWARAAAESFAEHHRATRFMVVILGDPEPGQLRDGDPFEVCTPADLGISQVQLDWLELIYDGLELCCALKPWLLRHLLSEADVALYLDSDTLVYDSLVETATRALEVGLVVSPHSLAPRTEDGLPNDDSLLQVGQFNAGLVAVGRLGLPFLDWWAIKLARECTRLDPATPLRFLDQRWLDLVVNYFPCVVDRDPGVNVARWNLFQRRLELGGERYLVDGKPLRLFHFSCFDPDTPSVLSRDAPPHPTTDPQRSPALKHLVDDYVERLVRAGWTRRAPAQGFPERAGITLTPPVRAAIRAALIESERDGVVPAAGPRDDNALRAWLRAPVGDGGVSWYLRGLWRTQEELRGVFPNILGVDEHRFAAWSLGEGVSRGLVPAVLAGLANPIRLDDPRAFVVLLDAREIVDDPSLFAGVRDAFWAADDVTFLLHAPGWDLEMLESDLAPVLSASGLAGPGAPDLLALIDPAGPGALAPWVHAILTRRPPAGLAELPRVADAASLRALADRALELAA
jgi:hypothetical protein